MLTSITFTSAYKLFCMVICLCRSVSLMFVYFGSSFVLVRPEYLPGLFFYCIIILLHKSSFLIGKKFCLSFYCILLFLMQPFDALLNLLTVDTQSLVFPLPPGHIDMSASRIVEICEVSN